MLYSSICLDFISFSFEDRIPFNIGNIVSSLLTSLLMLNSLLNPLIYTVRIISFRIALFQMLARKTLEQLLRNLNRRYLDQIKSELYKHKIVASVVQEANENSEQ